MNVILNVSEVEESCYIINKAEITTLVPFARDDNKMNVILSVSEVEESCNIINKAGIAALVPLMRDDMVIMAPLSYP